MQELSLEVLKRLKPGSKVRLCATALLSGMMQAMIISAQTQGAININLSPAIVTLLEVNAQGVLIETPSGEQQWFPITSIAYIGVVDEEREKEMLEAARKPQLVIARPGMN